MRKYSKISKLNNLLALILATLLLVSILVWQNGHRRSYAGLGEPIQKELTGETAAHSVIEKKIGSWDVDIDRLYSYEISALVVHTKDYLGFGVEKRLGPRDLALTWGDVAACNEDSGIKWSQANRFCMYECEDMEMHDRLGGVDGISLQMSNTHCIPADGEVWRKLFLVRTGDVVKMKGYLVNVDGEKSNGTTMTWHSSTTREDTGDGACEVFYIEDIKWIDY